MEKLFKQASDLIKKSGKILIVSHRKPDADTLGAAIALKKWLNKKDKDITLACYDKPGRTFSFLPDIKSYVQEFDLKNFDLMIIVDAGASYMTNFHLKYDDFFDSGIPIINIDHHASNDNFGDINIVDTEAASVTVILFKMFKHLGVEIDQEMATCLLAGIYNDTGSFMHANSTKEVFDIASKLMDAGAKIAEISKALFNTKTVSTLRLWGKVLEKAQITDDNIAMSVLKDDEFDQAGASPENLTGVIDYLNMIPGTKFSVLVNEDRKGNVKGSFRTRRSNIDLSRIAAVFGGGGHPKASGFMMPGKLSEEVKYKIVNDDNDKKSLEF